MLIKNGLKMSSRSLQERSKMPQDVQRPPTWAQHGANMGPTWGPRRLQDRSTGGQIALPKGLQLRLLSDRPHGPHMDPKCTPNEPQVGVMLGSSWGRLGVILGSSWGHLGVILGSSWGHFGITLRSLWDHIWITLGSLWDHFGTVLVPQIFTKMLRSRFWLQNQDLGPSPGANYAEFRALPVPTGPGRLKGAGGRGRSP